MAIPLNAIPNVKILMSALPHFQLVRSIVKYQQPFVTNNRKIKPAIISKSIVTWAKKRWRRLYRDALSAGLLIEHAILFKLTVLVTNNANNIFAKQVTRALFQLKFEFKIPTNSLIWSIWYNLRFDAWDYIGFSTGYNLVKFLSCTEHIIIAAI